MRIASQLIDICHPMAAQTVRSLYHLKIFSDIAFFTYWILPRPATDVSVLFVFQTVNNNGTQFPFFTSLLEY